MKKAENIRIKHGDVFAVFIAVDIGARNILQLIVASTIIQSGVFLQI